MNLETSYCKYLEDLEKEYSRFLQNVFSKPFWNGEPYDFQRIKCQNSNIAKKLIEEFNMPGIYILGYDEQPLYIGKAQKQSLKKRFSRYTFGAKSQYILAKRCIENKYEEKESLRIEDIMIRYNIGRSRAIGVYSFAQVDPDDVWFILIPKESEKVSIIEPALISIGNKWNLKRGLPHLINLDL